MSSILMPYVVFSVPFIECHFAETHYTECHNDDRHYAVRFRTENRGAIQNARVNGSLVTDLPYFLGGK